MSRFVASMVALILVGGGCASAGTPSATPGVSPPPTTTALLPSASASPTPTAAATQASAEVPAGRIVFHRQKPSGGLDYFTIHTDGTDEKLLAPIGDCAPCVRWSPDGTRIWTMGSTAHGTWSFTTMLPDGSDRVVIEPPIETLSLGPGMPSFDGAWIAFDGWDETEPAHTGLYLGSPDLADLHLVTPLPEGTVRTDPFGITPDGSQVLFFADRGQTEHAEGDLFAVNADGSDLRLINPPGTTHNFIDVPSGSLSPDGEQAAFGVANAVYVIDLDGGEARPITGLTGFVSAVAWSPTGEWITFTRNHGTRAAIALVRPDGTDEHEISASDGSDEAALGVWSPDGTHLLVQREGAAGRDLWIMNLEGDYVAQVTHVPADYGSYSWALVQP